MANPEHLTDSLFSSQPVRCDKCNLVLDKRHTLDECRDATEFRRKARESFEALSWDTTPSGGGGETEKGA